MEPVIRAQYFVGLDLGQSQDYTGVAVVERAEMTGAWDAVTYAYRKKATLRLRHLERLPLGTPYPEIAWQTDEVTRELAGMGTCHLMVDATGVGRPVVDLLRQSRMACEMWPVTITGGESEGGDGWSRRVPKRDLISGLQVLLQRGDLQIAAGERWGKMLLEEMGSMRVKVGLSGRERYGAWREGEHDDLVLAVTMACWGARTVFGEKVVGNVGYCARDGVEVGMRQQVRLF